MKRLIVAAVLLGSFPAMAVDLVQIRALLAQSQAAEAYQQLAADEATQGGNPEFDYLLGVAALDSGRATEAVSAFERLLAVDPAHHGARLELARAYFALGADSLAEREFSQLQSLAPPPQARGAIEQYLRAIASRRQGAGPQHRGFLEAGIGFDDNITAVTDNFSAGAEQTYGIAGILPGAGNATRRKDGLYSVSGGWNYRAPLQQWLFDSELAASYKGYFDNGAYDSTSVSGGLGLGYRSGNHFLRAGLFALGSWQATEQTGSEGNISNDRTLAGVSGQWRHDFAKNHQSSLQLQFNQVRYADVPINDINQAVVSAGWAFGLGDSAVVLTSASAGRDQAQNNLPGGQDYSRNTFGLRVNGQWQATSRLGLYALLGLALRRDLDPQSRAAIDGLGRDTSVDATVGASWLIRGPWSARAQYSFSQNNSNFDLYDFRRNDVSLVVRRDFR